MAYMFIFMIPSLLFAFKVFDAKYEWLIMISPSHAANHLITSAVTGEYKPGMIIVGCLYLLILAGILFRFVVCPKFKDNAVRGNKMRKYMSLLKYEAKTTIRDPINIYMLAFPAIILALSAFVFPMIFDSIDPMKGAMLKITMLLLIIIILTFGPFFLAIMATFLLLEHKDEHTLTTIAVTPVGTSGYLKFKLTYTYLMSVVGIIIVLGGTKLLAGDKYSIMGVSFSAAQAPRT